MQLRVRLANNLRFDDNIRAVGGFVPRAAHTHAHTDMGIDRTSIHIQQCNTYEDSFDASTPKCCKLIYIFIYTTHIMWINFALSWICCFDMPPVYTECCTNSMWREGIVASKQCLSHISHTLEHRIRTISICMANICWAAGLLGCCFVTFRTRLQMCCVQMKWCDVVTLVCYRCRWCSAVYLLCANYWRAVR